MPALWSARATFVCHEANVSLSSQRLGHTTGYLDE
jgi:hypothetical protein